MKTATYKNLQEELKTCTNPTIIAAIKTLLESHDKSVQSATSNVIATIQNWTEEYQKQVEASQKSLESAKANAERYTKAQAQFLKDADPLKFVQTIHPDRLQDQRYLLQNYFSSVLLQDIDWNQFEVRK